MFQNFPLYVGYLWITKAPIISGNIRLEMDSSGIVKKDGLVSFFVTLEPQSWKETFNYCSINQPRRQQSISIIIQNIFSGQLL